MLCEEGCVVKVDSQDIIDGKFSVPDGVTSIGGRAFEGCTNLGSIRLPDGVTSIGELAFASCTSLGSISLPKGTTSIGRSVFYKCTELSSIHLPDGVISIDNGVFEGCTKLSSIHLPDGVTSIGFGAFIDCANLSSISLPDGVTSIGDGAFDGCTKLSSIHLPAGVTSIAEATFKDCTSLSSIHLPAGVTSIGKEAFKNCTSLSSIYFPDGVLSIGNGVFKGCAKLSSIHLPGGVTSIGKRVFKDCVSLKSIFIDASTAEDFARIKSLLPKVVRFKARHLATEYQEINAEIEGLKELIEQADDSKGMDKVNTSIDAIQTRINDLNPKGAEQQNALDLVIMQAHLAQRDFRSALDYFESRSLAPESVLELISALFVEEMLPLKYQAIIHLFKDYYHNEDIQTLLNQSALGLWWPRSSLMVCNKEFQDCKIECFLPCSAIIQSVMDSKDVSDELKEQFKEVGSQLFLLKPKDLHQLLNSAALQDVLSERYGTTNIVSYESMITLSGIEELQGYNQQEGEIPAAEDILRQLTNTESKRKNRYQEITTDAIAAIKVYDRQESIEVNSIERSSNRAPIFLDTIGGSNAQKAQKIKNFESPDGDDHLNLRTFK